MTELRIFCVDDEPLALRRMEVLIGRLTGATWVGEASDAETALTLIAERKPDVVLLDIELGDVSGLDVAAALAARELRVVFVTAYPEFALEAFGVAARDYLLKPVSQARLEAAIARIRRDVERGGGREPESEEAPALWVRKRDMSVRVDVREIEWVSADRDYVHVHSGAESYMLRKTLSEMQETLGPARFVRVHKSHLVRADLIRRVRNRGGGDVSILLPAGQTVRVGRAYQPAVRALAAV